MQAKLAPYFKPEFLNRFDDIVSFNALTKDDLTQIVDLMLADMNTAIAVQGLHLDVSPEATAKLVTLGYNPTMGARPLRRVIQERIVEWYRVMISIWIIQMLSNSKQPLLMMPLQ